MASLARRALVTGGSEGLGRCLALELAVRDFSVTLVGRRKDRLEEVVGCLAGWGHDVVAADLADPKSAEFLSKTIATRQYDLLVNNAGGSRFGRFDELSSVDVRKIIELNFTTPALLSWAFVRSAASSAMLVNVTSVTGLIGTPGNAAYSAAKAGLQSLTACLWYEAAARGIHVLDFRPDSLKTGFHAAGGKASMAARGMSITPERAAKDLADAIEAHRGFVYPYGRMALPLMAIHRALPKRWLVRLMAWNAERAGYL